MNEFPSFKTVFERGITVVPRYLVFLNLFRKEDEIRDALNAVSKSINFSPNPSAEVQALLAETDWRPNLVGAIAVLLSINSASAIQSLWNAIDRGSWVSPQLAVTAFRADENFKAEAIKRIVSGCKIDKQRLESLEPSMRHILAGPSDSFGRSAKAMTALVYLYKKLPGASDGLDAIISMGPIERLLKSDEDNGGEIAEDWLNAITKYV
jgi:hypothetical protein